MSASRDEKSVQEATSTATQPLPSSALEKRAEETMTLESIPLEIYFLFLDKLNPSDWHKLALTYSFLFQVCTHYTEAGWKKKLKRELGIDKPLKRYQDSSHPYHQTYIHWNNQVSSPSLKDYSTIPFEKLKKGYVQLHWFLFEEHNMDVVLQLLTDEKELGKISCVELLAETPDRRDDKTIIHRLVEEGQQTTLDQLYPLAKKREQPYDQFHGIKLAAAFNQLEEVKALLSQSVIGEVGKLSLLHIAAYFGHEEMLTLVLPHSAKLVNAPSYLGTPLNLAIRYNHHAMVQPLLDAGARSNSEGGIRFEGKKIDAYPLAVAVKIRSLEMVSLLIAHYAYVNCPAHDDNQMYMLPLLSVYLNSRAINSTEYEIIKLLLSHGAQLEYRFQRGDNPLLPLYRAITFNHVSVLKLFIVHFQASDQESILPELIIPYTDRCLAPLLFLFLFLSPATSCAYSKEERALLMQEIDEKTPASKLHEIVDQLCCNGVNPACLFNIFNFYESKSELKNKLLIAREFHRPVNTTSPTLGNRSRLFSLDIRFTWQLFEALKNKQGDFANTDTTKCVEIEKTLQRLAKATSHDLLNALLATHYFSLVDLENTAVSHEEQLVNCLHQLETLDENHDDVDRLKLHCYYILIYGLESGLPLSWQDIFSDDLGKATYDFIREYYFSSQSQIPSLFIQTQADAKRHTAKTDQISANISCLGLFALPSEIIQNSAKDGKEKEKPISKNAKRK